MGPTASGKTDLAIALRAHLPADIISVDSAMIYRGMDIGTAKPMREELQQAPHRLIDICNPTDSYSVGQFCADAMTEIQDIVSHQRIPLLVGGTMMYFHQLLHGMATLPEANQSVRGDISAKAQIVGWEAMHAELAKVDPVSAAKIRPQDPQRISRALEVYALTGRPISAFHENNKPSYLANYDVIQIALIPEDRAWLHERIAKRFDAMLAAGFLDEAKRFYDNPVIHADLPAMRMVGYRQAWPYFAGEIDLETFRERAIAATRQLAKRQLTWLRRWENLHRFDPTDPQLMERVLSVINKK